MIDEAIKLKWHQVFSPFGGTNYILQGDGFHISYNPNTGSTIFGSFFAGDGDGEETALCIDDKFYILNGDFRDAYERLFDEGFDACKKFYDQQSAHADSSWTIP